MNYALCIGINNYPGSDMDLSGCVNDARDWARMFRAREFSVATLYDNKATHASMLKAFKGIVTKAVAGDIVAIQYSGHGTYIKDTSGDEADGRDECLVPYDIMTAGPITDDSLYNIFKMKMRGVKIIFISDSCHSGTVLRAFDLGDSKGKKKFMPPGTFLKGSVAQEEIPVEHVSEDDVAFRDTEGVLLLFAGCQDIQYSMDANFNGKANGAFTYFALKALKEMPESATYTQWFKKIRTYLPSSDYDQAPNLYGAGMRSKIFA